MRTLTTICLLTVVALVLACGGAADPKRDGRRAAEKPPEPAARDDWASVGAEAVSGDARISVAHATVTEVQGQQRGRIANFRATCATVRITNTSSVRILRWDGWQGLDGAADEHGNALRALLFTGYEFDANLWESHGVPGHAITDGAKAIDPGKTVAAVLFYEPAPPTSKELRLTLPLSVPGQASEKTVRFRLPIAHGKQ